MFPGWIFHLQKWGDSVRRVQLSTAYNSDFKRSGGGELYNILPDELPLLTIVNTVKRMECPPDFKRVASSPFCTVIEGKCIQFHCMPFTSHVEMDPCV